MTLRELPADLEQIAKKQLNEEPKRRQQDINAIKEWLKKQRHLRARDDDQWILTFLRGCKFSLEKTKAKLDTYYTMRSLCPDLFENRDPFDPKIQELLSKGIILPLGQDKKGRRVNLIRMRPYDLKKISILDMMKLQFMFMDILLLEDDRAIVAGVVSIMDFKEMSFEMLMSFTPFLMKKIMALSQEGYPVRPKDSHYVNTPSAFDSVFNILKTFMKKKILDRVHLHGKDLGTLYDHIPKELMPKDYGGEGKSCEEIQAEWKAKIESYKEWFKEDENYGSDEKKREGKAKTSSDLFGVEGSFRNLTVD